MRKRGLWGWHHSKMERASSVERLWLAMALAQLWCVSLGCQAEAEFEAACLHHEPGALLPERHIARQRRTRALGQRPARRLSCVVRGRLILLAMHYQSEPFVVGILWSEPWPQTITTPRKQLTPAPGTKRKTRKEKERRKRQKRRARERSALKVKKPYTCKGYVVPIENGCWIVTLVGWLRDYPPNNEQGFLDYAQSLQVPDLYEAIKDAEPITPIVTHKFPASRRRHYEQMSRFPEGLMILGDAACSFNPIYGQGMTAAALEASTLNDCLCQRLRNAGEDNPIRLTQHCQRAIAKVVKVPWLLATSEDFHYPETIGKRPKGMRLLNWYIGKVHALVGSYPLATLRFYEVLHMLKPPMTLFEPGILFAVFFKRRFMLRSHELDMNPHHSLQRHHVRVLERLKH
jgi:hypothetical protein